MRCASRPRYFADSDPSSPLISRYKRSRWQPCTGVPWSFAEHAELPLASTSASLPPPSMDQLRIRSATITSDSLWSTMRVPGDGHPKPAACDCRSGASTALDFTTSRLNSRTDSATRYWRLVQDGQGGAQSPSRRRSVGSTHVDIAARLFQPAPQTDPLAKCWLSVTTSGLSSTLRHAAGGVLIVKCLLAAALSLVAALNSNGSPRAFPQVDETASDPSPRHRASLAVHLRGAGRACADERRLLSGIVG